MAYPQTFKGARLDQDGRARDGLGRQTPRRLGFDSFLRTEWGPGLAELFAQEVPGSFWNQDTDEDGDPIAVIACPCGEEPVCELNRSVECPCERFYLFLGDRVRVYRPEGVQAGLPDKE